MFKDIFTKLFNRDEDYEDDEEYEEDEEKENITEDKFQKIQDELSSIKFNNLKERTFKEYKMLEDARLLEYEECNYPIEIPAIDIFGVRDNNSENFWTSARHTHSELKQFALEMLNGNKQAMEDFYRRDIAVYKYKDIYIFTNDGRHRTTILQELSANIKVIVIATVVLKN